MGEYVGIVKFEIKERIEETPVFIIENVSILKLSFECVDEDLEQKLKRIVEIVRRKYTGCENVYSYGCDIGFRTDHNKIPCGFVIPFRKISTLEGLEDDLCSYLQILKDLKPKYPSDKM